MHRKNLASISICVSVVIVYFWLSFSSFCILDMKFHPIEDAKRIALMHLVNSGTINLSINNADEAEAYIESNINCCKWDEGMGEAVIYPVWDVLLCRGAHVVRIIAPNAERNLGSGKYYESFVRVNCGKVTATIGTGTSRSKL